MTDPMNTPAEPLRLRGYTALAVGLVALAILQWSMGASLQVVAGGLALVVVTNVGGLEWARRHTTPWTPEPLDGPEA